jgi:hypothetical protein
MKKFYIPLIAGLCTADLYAQSISPGSIYGASNVSQAGGVSLEWVLGSINAFPNLSVLPVKLIRFEGKLTAEGFARLEWETAEEYNNAGFELHKSADGKNFAQIAFLDGAGNLNAHKSYEYIDQDLTTTSYYRLKQLDIDGEFTWSKIVSVIPEIEQLNRFKIFPNPSIEQKVTVQLPAKTRLLGLYDKYGTLLQEIKNPGTKQILDIPNSGVYLVHIECASGNRTLPIVRE